jgi:two-component system, chemotaxis family, protein-glutamate methylesterase/glutaminase
MILTPKIDMEKVKLVVIGASAGGVEALKAVLPKQGAPYATAVVLHLPPGEKSLLPSIFNSFIGSCASEPEDKEPILPGRIYFAPASYHLLVERDLTFSLSVDPPVHFSRPAVDMLFDSAAEAGRTGVLGIVLTGANSDGAQGLRCVLNRGGQALIQAPQTAYAPEMPRAALEACPDAQVLTLPEIRGILETSSSSLSFP